ncbi:hypothetical protein SAMN05414139_05697 [Burkholderia sp. D7]|nr:hypothetical protein SAMN05414139_05697 [Burkholderia sp. D7]
MEAVHFLVRDDPNFAKSAGNVGARALLRKRRTDPIPRQCSENFLFTLRRIFAETIRFMGSYNIYPFIIGQGGCQLRSTSGVDVADTMCYEVMLASKPAHERRSVASK